MLYLIDEAYGKNGLNIAEFDDDARVVLIQNGVYLDVSGLTKGGKEVYALEEDVDKRGVAGRLDSKVKLIDYGELVDLIVENKVVNFA